VLRAVESTVVRAYFGLETVKLSGAGKRGRGAGEGWDAVRIDTLTVEGEASWPERRER
jgi:hypothetical protein